MDITAILARYRLTATGEPEKLTGGVDNDNITVPTYGGDVVIRRYRHSPVDKITAELDLVKFLSDNGFPTPGPLTTTDGETLVNDGLPVAVFPRLSGAAPAEIDAALATQTGRLLARLHTLTLGWTDRRIPVVDRIALLRAAAKAPIGIDGETYWQQTVREFLDHHAERLSAMDDLPTGPLHHDLHRHNLLTTGKTITAVLDFDELNHGPLIIDVARALFYLAADRDDTTLDGEIADALVAGYHAQRPLSRAERDLLPVAFDVAALVDAADFLANDAHSLGIAHVTQCRSLAVFTGNRAALR